MRAYSLFLAATAWWVAACGTTAPVPASPAVPGSSRSNASGRERPWLSAERLMEACWEPGPPAEARIHLVFFSAEGSLRQVTFEAVGGATPSVGRCAREVALSYPWPEGGAPERLVLAPPVTGASGWAQLGYVSLLARDRAASLGQGASGLRDPAPLVHACLRRMGAAMTRARFRLLSSPTRVEVVHEGAGGEGGARLPAERCAAAVLGATAWPTGRAYSFDFQRWEDAPPPASPEAVAAYFPDAGELPPLGAETVQEGMARLRPAVSVCWEQALRRRPDLRGGRSVQFVVAADGRVKTAAVAPHGSDAPDEAADYLLDRCLLEALGQHRFQAPGGKPARASYSWVFAHR
ncbi:hypothetical protein P2318_22500 [Myxococcaceae bacterium GXIMD 01537]